MAVSVGEEVGVGPSVGAGDSGVVWTGAQPKLMINRANTVNPDNENFGRIANTFSASRTDYMPDTPFRLQQLRPVRTLTEREYFTFGRVSANRAP